MRETHGGGRNKWSSDSNVLTNRTRKIKFLRIRGFQFAFSDVALVTTINQALNARWWFEIRATSEARNLLRGIGRRDKRVRGERCDDGKILVQYPWQSNRPQTATSPKMAKPRSREKEQVCCYTSLRVIMTVFVIVTEWDQCYLHAYWPY